MVSEDHHERTRRGEEHADGVLRSLLRGLLIMAHGGLALIGIWIVFWLVTGSWDGHTATIGESLFTLAGTIVSVLCSAWLGYHTIPRTETLILEGR